MVQTLRSSELYSHPNKLLEDHLVGVAKLSSIFLNEKPRHIFDELSDTIKLACLFHDIGKATSFFQNYLRSPNKGKKSEYTHHSFLSAVLGLFFSVVLKDKTKAFLVYYLIRNHHKDFANPMDTLSIDKKDIDLLFEQTQSIDSNKFEVVLKKLADYYPPLETIVCNFNFSQIFEFYDKLESIFLLLRKHIKQSTDLFGIENYLLLNLAGSILLDADKSDVTISDADFFLERKDIPDDCVDKYLRKLDVVTSSNTPNINLLRKKAYEEVISKVDSFLSNKIFSIDLPTGLGKTFVSFSFALKLRSKLNNKHRIIYCLPFLSIIEQNFFEITKVLEYNGIEVSSNVALKHHHLGELVYKTTDGLWEYDTDVSRILIEGWNSEIIVTTFYQLFHSLITNSNRNLRKFHRFANSIIILDEIQAIPIKYWKVLQEIFLQLANKLNTYILLVTATQPLIFNKNHILSLCNGRSYLENLNRIKLFPKLNPITIEDFVNEFEFDGRRTLFVLNSIASAKKLFSLIQQKVERCTFLSTHILPFHRQMRILEIKEGKYDVVVSTQLIEAGVDVDFELVFRDIAPFDSIIQSSGRCNRNSKKFGYVTVLNLVENGKSISNYIYDPILLEITKDILSKYDELNEPELYSLSEKYFIETSQKKTQIVSEHLLRAIKKLHYHSDDQESLSISSFRIFEDDYPKMDVFVEIDSKAVEIWQSFLNILEIKDRFERKKQFDKIRNVFYDYVISVPKNVMNRPEEFVGDLGYIPREKLENYYDFETGYKLKEELSFVVI